MASPRQSLTLALLAALLVVGPVAYATAAPAQSSSSSSSATGIPEGPAQSPAISLPTNGKFGAYSSSQNSSSSPTVSPFVTKRPSVIDPAGPVISLQSSEAIFTVAAGLNACGYDVGLEESDILRSEIRASMNQTLATSEKARSSRDNLCKFVILHRLTTPSRDLAQYISLALYLTPPPEMEPSAELTAMPPDATQVVEVLPLLRDFAAEVNLHSLWLGNKHRYDEMSESIHDALSTMIVNTNAYLKMPASTYDGRRFVVVLEPLLSPHSINARVYGTDYVIVTSPSKNGILMKDVRHTYLHYLIEPLLYSRANSMDRMLPILKTVRDAPLDFLYRSDIVSLTIECLIKAVETRTMDTGVPVFKMPAKVLREDLVRVEAERSAYQHKVDSIRQQAVQQQMREGYVLVGYFYQKLIQFEKEPDGLKEVIGEMVYGMDVEQETHRARDIDFLPVGDSDVFEHARAHLSGLDLAESKLAEGDAAAAAELAQKAIANHIADPGRAHYILAMAMVKSGKAQEAETAFQQTLTESAEPRLLAWSHIYLGRMLDLSCKRDEAVTEYQKAFINRDGQQDTLLAVQRGLKEPFAVKGHSCDADQEDAATPAEKSAAPKTNP
jgi:tetratricopeptide (TPR) repeat protein